MLKWNRQKNKTGALTKMAFLYKLVCYTAKLFISDFWENKIIAELCGSAYLSRSSLGLETYGDDFNHDDFYPSTFLLLMQENNINSNKDQLMCAKGMYH